MRCITCSEQMVLAQVMPAQAGLADGFESQTLQCPGCGAIESRFVFAGGVNGTEATRTATSRPDPQPARRNEPNHFTLPRVKGFSVPAEKVPTPETRQIAFETAMVSENVTDASDQPRIREEFATPPVASSKAWGRAVEKFRTYEADVQRRARSTKQPNLTTEFDKAWDGARADQPHNGFAAPQPDNPDEKGVIREVVDPPPHRGSGAVERPVLSRANPLRGFDEFWESLGPARTRPQEEVKLRVEDRAKDRAQVLPDPASLAPLPRSRSLVPVEPIVARTMRYLPAASKKMWQNLYNALQGAVRLHKRELMRKSSPL
jgi:hypothetical protein